MTLVSALNGVDQQRLTPPQVETLAFFVQHGGTVDVPLRVCAGAHARMCDKLVERGILDSHSSRELTTLGLETLQIAILSRRARSNPFREGNVARERYDNGLLENIGELLEYRRGSPTHIGAN